MKETGSQAMLLPLPVKVITVEPNAAAEQLHTPAENLPHPLAAPEPAVPAPPQSTARISSSPLKSLHRNLFHANA